MINSEAQKATILNVNSVPQHATIDVKYLSQSRNKKNSNQNLSKLVMLLIRFTSHLHIIVSVVGFKVVGFSSQSGEGGVHLIAQLISKFICPLSAFLDLFLL